MNNLIEVAGLSKTFTLHQQNGVVLQVLQELNFSVRGGSHSGNIAAAELARHGVLDILSSDYYPSSLLHAAWLLAGQDNDYDLPAAIATVSRAPVQAAGLNDRGEIQAGLRADLVHARLNGAQPIIQQVWQQGRRVF